MTPGGDLANNDRTPGLLGGDNVLFNNPWTFLPPGTTGDRPTPAADMYYRLRFNTDDQLYEYYDAVLAMWTQLQETLFTAGPYLIYEADPAFPDAFNLGALTSGILKQDVTAGVSTPSIAVNDVDFYGPGMIGFLQAPAGIKDINGNNIITFNAQPLAVNYIDLSNNGTGLYPVISVMGPDADIGFTINCKGIGGFLFSTEANTPITIQSGTGRQHNTHLIFPDTLATRNVTFQDSDGTVAYLSDIPSITPSALTTANDTNVTLTLGGTPLTSLLQSVSLTLGWTGILSEDRGGTGIAALGTGVATALGQNVTGSGGIVLETSPTITTPIIVGVSNGSAAAAGQVGQILSNTSTGVAMTSTIPAMVTTLSLTAGDWDVWGSVKFVAAATTTITTLAAAISTSSGAVADPQVSFNLPFTTGNTNQLVPTQITVNVGSTTNVYINGYASFGISTMTCDGFIYARRRH